MTRFSVISRIGIGILFSLGAATARVGPARAQDAAPIVTAPSTQSVCPGTQDLFTVGAADPDGDPIFSFTASGLPTGATFTTNATNTSGTFQWTPTFTDSGTRTVVFTASNALSGSATTVIQILTCDPAPTVTAPAAVSGSEGSLITFTVTANSRSGDTITSLTASPLPTGATFTADASNTSGTFAWTPSPSQSGNYTVSFTATASFLSGSSQTAISVADVDRPPVVLAPATATAPQNSLLTITVSATDPDNDAITSLTATGTAMAAGATFTAGAGNTSGTLSWTPNFMNSGIYSATFTASNQLAFSATTTINVIQQDCRVRVFAPATVTGSEGELLTFVVTAVDPCGSPVRSLTASPLPAGATLTINASQTSGTFNWTPGPSQLGTYLVTFTAVNSSGIASSAMTQVNIVGDRPPIADAGGPYSGFVGAPLAFDGTGSSDPDGNPLTYSWSFGDGGMAVGPTPTHVYTTMGSYTATLTVTDGTLSGSAAAPVTIQETAPARVFITKSRYRTIRLGNRNSQQLWCVWVEPVDGSFSIGDIEPFSTVFEYNDSYVGTRPTKGAVVADSDANGIPDIEFCFGVADLANLPFPVGTNTVTVRIRGRLANGAAYAGDIAVEVINGSGSLSASIRPNPLNPEAVLSFQTTRIGRVRVQIFDLAGRLVRTLRDREESPGPHEVRVDGRSSAGTPFSSGVYFYRIETAEGISQGRFTVLK